eukprot:m.42962 g.42962  ORF g.42962 m.42962 type:complete len:106 (+) comp8379_c0_seq1:1546-1863(+)
MNLHDKFACTTVYLISSTQSIQISRPSETQFIDPYDICRAQVASACIETHLRPTLSRFARLERRCPPGFVNANTPKFSVSSANPFIMRYAVMPPLMVVQFQDRIN